MIARVVRPGSLAAALVIGTAAMAFADNDLPAGTKPAHGLMSAATWACGESSTVSSAASSGPAAGIGVPNDQTGGETSTAAGRSTGSPGQQQLLSLLSQQGYTGVRDIRCESGAWTFHASRNGTEDDLRVDPQSGAVESQ